MNETIIASFWCGGGEKYFCFKTTPQTRPVKVAEHEHLRYYECFMKTLIKESVYFLVYFCTACTHVSIADGERRDGVTMSRHRAKSSQTGLLQVLGIPERQVVHFC